MTVAQRAVRSGIDHTDSRATVPSVAKDGEAAARKIHIEPVRQAGRRRARKVRLLDSAEPIGEARRRLRGCQVRSLECCSAGQQQRAYILRRAMIQGE